MSEVVVIDYGMGNLLSVARALEHCGARVVVSDDARTIRSASKLLLPGVGAFRDGMKELESRGLVEPIREFARSGKLLAGVCLGMQMLFAESEEFGAHSGLGVLPGRVLAIPKTKSDGSSHKIPHIGWNALAAPNRAKWESSLLKRVSPGAYAYFVHSFTASPEVASDRLADCDYNGRLISAAVQRENVYGFQFHPEKSGEVGLAILDEFVRA